MGLDALDIDSVLATDLAVALTHHRRRLREQHYPIPPGLVELEEMARQWSLKVPDGSSLDGARNVPEDGAMAPLLLTLDETVGVLGLSLSTVKRLVTSNELPALRVGRSVRVHRDELERYADKLRTGCSDIEAVGG